jgi:hypothetical protein
MTATVFSLKAKKGQHPFSLSHIASVLNVPGKLESRHEVIKILLLFFLKFLTNALPHLEVSDILVYAINREHVLCLCITPHHHIKDG